MTELLLSFITDFNDRTVYYHCVSRFIESLSLKLDYLPELIASFEKSVDKVLVDNVSEM